KPHALTSISGIPGVISTNQTITYTDFKKVNTITENGNVLAVSYGTDEQRIKTVLTKPNKIQTRYYMGNYEEEIIGSNIRKIHYICGGNGLAAILVQNAGKDTLYYVHTDYQGSLIALSLPDGTVAERYAYDPWGNRRNPNDWSQKDNRTAFIINRGYTMHEHLPEFKLINMNGRVYDPVTAQFFSPDPYVQKPGDWLNYNRYSYCLNNPFKYTDPSGELIGEIITTLAMMYIGGVQANFFTSNHPTNPITWNWSSPKTYAGLASGISSGVTYGIGSAFGHGVGSVGNELLRAGAHGAFGGLMSWASSGNFWQGFAIGGLSSLAGSGMQGLHWDGNYLPLVTGLTGAGAAWAMGGDPMSGFMQGFGIGALNHKGEIFITDDGKLGELSCDDAVIWGNVPFRQEYGQQVWGIWNEQVFHMNKAKNYGPSIDWGGPWEIELPLRLAKWFNFRHKTSDIINAPIYSHDIIVKVHQGLTINRYYYTNTLRADTSWAYGWTLQLGDTLNLVKDSAGIITRTPLKTTYHHVAGNFWIEN
ncbi:MAG: RHS repeat-associated core domain-containing protein, partial [Candidatus Symbiothrix sp.]|nr:RHS repeat-associated core domain-containing protein [Candidatus Symbiothrix sp.]